MVRPELERMVGNDETVLWRGAPNRKAFFLRSMFNILLPISIVWCCFDIPMIVSNIDTITIHFVCIFLIIAGLNSADMIVIKDIAIDT